MGDVRDPRPSRLNLYLNNKCLKTWRSNYMHSNKVKSLSAIKAICFFSSFSVIGLLLSIWFGLGWLILLQTFRHICFSVRPIYTRVIIILFGKEYVEEILSNKKGPLFFNSWKSAFVTLGMIGLTILFFWKINIPLISIFRLINK